MNEMRRIPMTMQRNKTRERVSWPERVLWECENDTGIVWELCC